MHKNYEAIGDEYYSLIGQKNLEGIKKYLHPDVEYFGPLMTLKGKEAVIEAYSYFMKLFKSLTIRTKFGSKDQAMIVYAVDVPGIPGVQSVATLLNFRDGMIIRIENFEDPRFYLDLVKKKNEINI